MTSPDPTAAGAGAGAGSSSKSKSKAADADSSVRSIDRAIDGTPLRPHAEIEQWLYSDESFLAVERKLIDGKLIWAYKNQPRNGRDFWRTMANLWADRQYVGLNDEIYTYAQVAAQADIMARWLRLAYGVRKGDRVAVIARNMPEFVIAYWAIHLIGGVATLINAFSNGDGLAFSIQDVDCRVVICDVERLERLEPFLPSLFGKQWSLQGIVVISRRADEVLSLSQRRWRDNRMPHIADLDQLTAQYSTPAAEQLYATLGEEDIEPEDNAAILFTSGTTARPKGVLASQRQHFACAWLTKGTGVRVFFRRRLPLPDPTLPQNVGRGLILIPLFHTTGAQSGMVSQATAGNYLHFMSSWDAHKALEIVVKHKLKSVLGIGFMIREILSKGTPEQLAQLYGFSHGGAAASASLPAEVRRARPDAMTGIGYGSTETGGVAAAIAGDDYHTHPTSVGLPPVGVELIVMDPVTLTQVKPGEQGELWVRGPGVCKGYWNRPKDTAEAFLPDGWFRTGDAARIDPESGFVYIVDRIKQIIIRGGENISTLAVEDAVYQHPDVQECAAVPFADELLGERVAVVVQVKASCQTLPTAQDIISVAAKTLPKFARPEYVWVRREELPHNPSGKVLKTDLKNDIKARLAREGGFKQPAKANL